MSPLRRVAPLFPLVLLAGLAFVVAAAPARARETERFVNAREVAATERARDFLLDVPFFLKGEPHPPVARTLSTLEVERTSSGALRSDATACEAAFLDALRILQEKARAAGGDALVDVVSITRGVEYESASAVRCVAGAVVVHVGLRAKVTVRGEPAASGSEGSETTPDE
ncbi:MAG: hypothetical protein R3E88_15730 [Myxococcota bacterium]